MLDECSPPIPVSRLIGRIGFVDAIGSVEADASDDIQEITFLGSFLMWNNAAVCCGRIWLKFFVSVWSDQWKSLEGESEMMFSVPLICCEYRDVSLLTSVHPRQRATASWDSLFTGSKDYLCIHTSELELSVNARICDPCPNLRMVVQMVNADNSNSGRFLREFPMQCIGDFPSPC